MESYDTYASYDAWARSYDSPNEASRCVIQSEVQALSWRPFFSFVLMPETISPIADLETIVTSLELQLYPDWELWIPESFRSKIATKDARIRTIKSSGDVDNHLSHIVETSIAVAYGDYILPIPFDIVVRPHALYELAKVINQDGGAALLYTDEDRIGLDGNRSSPRFKTGWDPDLALAKNFTGLLVAVKRELLRSIWNSILLSRNPDLAIYELSLCVAFAAEAQNIHHIPHVLCHRQDWTGVGSSWDAEGARDIVRRHLKRSNISARVVSAPLARECNLILHELPSPSPLVSIIIPTRDRVTLLERCVSSILANTSYPNFEILIIDNDSREAETFAFFEAAEADPIVRILKSAGPFNYSKLNNFAAGQARGEVLILLNNDTATINSNWMSEMVAQALRPDIGAVGAKLFYENGQVQHAGMIFQPGVGPMHQFRFSDRFDAGLEQSLALTRSVMIVTGACLAVRRVLYIEAGGLDEQLAVGYNDIDLCMRLGDLGYRTIWTPMAELFHFEGMSRGYDDTPEKRELATRELAHFSRRWGSLIQSDPFRNVNLDYHWDRVTLAKPPTRSHINP
jgi:O-antigen biosynthesis protein